MRYLTRDGLQIEGETARDLIDQLRNASNTPGPDLDRFLGILARGARLQTGFFVRTDSFRNALADLVRAGLLESLQ